MSDRGGEVEVWSWGAGTHGQLACAPLTDALTPQRVDALSGAAPIVDMACGGAHAVAVFDSGEVATWGRGQAGALGNGDESTIKVPKVISSLQGIRIRRAAAGWNHSAFVTESGDLYTCGDGTFGQLGHGHVEPRLRPCRVEQLSSICVTMVACGMRHTLALAIGSSEAKVVYAFGSNKRGQLGIQGSTHDVRSNDIWRILCPQKICSPDMQNVASVSANGDHSAALTGAGELFLWGRGYNNAPDLTWPHLVPADLKFCSVSLGWRHGLVLTDDKEVYAWGSNQCGQLGAAQALSETGYKSQKVTMFTNSDQLNEVTGKSEESERNCGLKTKKLKHLLLDFQKVDMQGRAVVWVSAGSEHSSAVLDNGNVIVWGWAEHGQLGLGSLKDQEVPHIVSFQKTRPVSRHHTETLINETSEWKGRRQVYCGSGFTFVVDSMFVA